MTGVKFTFRTGNIVIDYQRCAACKTRPCVDACKKFGTTLYKLEGGLPVLIYSVEDTGRRCIEDLSCEVYCQSLGNKGLVINLDMFGLDEYRKKVGVG
jgi:hypothetical protein